MIDSVHPPLGQEQEATGTKHSPTSPAPTNRPPEDQALVASPNGQAQLSAGPPLVPATPGGEEKGKRLLEFLRTVWATVRPSVPGTEQFVRYHDERIQSRVSRKVSRLEGVPSLSGKLDLVQSGYRKALYRLEAIEEWQDGLIRVLIVVMPVVVGYVAKGTPLEDWDTDRWIRQWMAEDYTWWRYTIMLFFGGLLGLAAFIIPAVYALAARETLKREHIDIPSLVQFVTIK